MDCAGANIECIDVNNQITLIWINNAWVKFSIRTSSIHGKWQVERIMNRLRQYSEWKKIATFTNKSIKHKRKVATEFLFFPYSFCHIANCMWEAYDFKTPQSRNNKSKLFLWGITLNILFEEIVGFIKWWVLKYFQKL